MDNKERQEVIRLAIANLEFLKRNVKSDITKIYNLALTQIASEYPPLEKVCKWCGGKGGAEIARSNDTQVWIEVFKCNVCNGTGKEASE